MPHVVGDSKEQYKPYSDQNALMPGLGSLSLFSDPTYFTYSICLGSLLSRDDKVSNNY